MAGGFSIIWPQGAMQNLSVKMETKFGTAQQDKIIGRIATEVRDIARSIAPRDKGGLARSISCKRNGPMDYETGSNLEYAWAVEFGSGVYGEGPAATHEVIEPKSGEYLSFKLDGRWMRVRYILGQHPQPFLRPALEMVAIEDLAADEMNKGGWGSGAGVEGPSSNEMPMGGT